MKTWLTPLLRALFAIAIAVGIGAPAFAHEAHAPAAAPAKPVRAELGASVAVAPDGSWRAVAVRSSHVVLYRSDDDGGSWSEVGAVNRAPEAISADGENRPKIAVDRDGAVLVSWARRFEERFAGDVRFARAADGRHFDQPVTVHRDRSVTGHSFNAMLLTSTGRLVLAWIDGRERMAAGETYRGSAIYAAVSDDGGRSFAEERKVADHSCQCCRLALVEDGDGEPLLLWRHVFEPNERDHAIVRLGPDGAAAAAIERATFDGWRIDACPHHGPSLALAPDGTRHAVWFNQREGEGRVFYGRLGQGAVDGQRPVGGPRAAHADVAVAGARVAIVWKEFDGERTALWAELSDDGGRTFTRHALAATAGASDQPRLLRRDDALFAFWHTENEGMKGYRLP
ncbi:MAG TPA: sialidase family protein [Rhodocyclaceae bacterium]|nr:sialidase family protein [Rhodocyclaceae bacterium]